VTRSHSNSKSHARARPKSILSGKFAKRGERCHDETCTRWFFIRYVTLKRCCFFLICSFFVFSRSILCLNLSLLATLVLSSEDVSYRCARARKHLQSSFLCIICSWRPRERKKSLVLIVLVRKTHEIISRFLFFVSLFFPPFREFHRRNELGTNQRDLFNDWQLLPNEVHQFLSVFRYREQEEREERFERDAASSDTYHGHPFKYSAACFLLRLCGFLRNKKVVLCRENSNIFLRKFFPGGALCCVFVVCYNEREQHTKHHDVVYKRSRDESEEEEGW